MAWVAVGLAGAAVVAVAAAPGLDGAVTVWRWLPLLWAAAVVLLMAATGAIGRELWGGLALIVLVCDLAAHGVVLERSFHTSAPIEQVRQAPAVVAVLEEADAGRFYVKEEILPALSVMQGALYPNAAVTYGQSSANLYMPLIPRSYLAWTDTMDAEALNRAGITHYLIPQLLPVDAASELYDVYNPFAALPYNEWIALDSVDTQGVEIESYLSHAADLADGTLAAEVVFRDVEGAELRVPVRVGLESAEWAYEREDVAAKVRHQLAPVAHSWPARSGYLPWEHIGHTYRAWAALGHTVTAVKIVPTLPEAYVRIEEITLVRADGVRQSLRQTIGQGRHEIIYRSEDVLVYANEDAWPRAYSVPWSQVAVDGRQVSLAGVTHDEATAVDIIEYTDMAVDLHLRATEESLLVLSDLDYPGWVATIDGEDAPIWRVDGVVRGVRVSAGEHEVLFHYHPLHWLQW
ncbi:MAG: hypothetical protein ABFD20_07610 [Anaerolineales bacterium]